jgi:hypothetical protein
MAEGLAVVGQQAGRRLMGILWPRKVISVCPRITPSNRANRLNVAVVRTPPPVPLGEAPITMATRIRNNEAEDMDAIGTVLKPLVEEAAMT